MPSPTPPALPASLSLTPIPSASFLAAPDPLANPIGASAVAAAAASESSLPTHLLNLAFDKLAAFPASSSGWKRLADQPGAKGGGARVESYSTADGWAGRRSEHASEELTWEQVVDHVYDAHYATETRFVPSFTAFAPLDPTSTSLARFAAPARLASPSLASRAALFKLHYTLPFPLKKRTFVVGLIQTVDHEKKEVWNVTVPVDDPGVDGEREEKRRVRARYTAVERLRVVDGGRIEWSMITLSHAGGAVPFALAKKHVPAEVAKDVGGLIDLLRDDARGAGTRPNGGDGGLKGGP